MAADSVEVTKASSAVGEIVARGRLLDREGNLLAGFQQKFGLWRGSRVLLLEVELDPKTPPGADPWNSYYACRFAWADETAELLRSVHQTRQAAHPTRLEAPHYLQVNSGEMRTTILTGGLPYHRRVGRRMLDSLLVVRGEHQRAFQLGLGVDLEHPIREAIGLMAPLTVVRETAAPPSPASSGWLFHVDSRSVIATHWSPLVDDGSVVGFRTRLLEANGRPARARLRCFRSLRWARQVNFLGEPLGDCRVEEGSIHVDLAANEWVEVEAKWSGAGPVGA
jgi:alpha-mannosidase